MFLGCVLDDTLPEGIVENDSDCDDSNDQIHPNAPDICDDIDNNCNQLIDEDLTATYYLDWDGDGFGSNTSIESCDPQSNYVQQSGDCDDTEFMIKPFVPEVCDFIDNNCDGQIDENVLQIYYADTDGDGFGDPNDTVESCQTSTLYIEDNRDCDDSDPIQNPNGTEVCNGEDDDCNEEVDENSIDAITMVWTLMAMDLEALLLFKIPVKNHQHLQDIPLFWIKAIAMTPDPVFIRVPQSSVMVLMMIVMEISTYKPSMLRFGTPILTTMTMVILNTKSNVHNGWIH